MVDQNTTLLQTLATFKKLQLLDLSSNNIDLLIPVDKMTLLARSETVLKETRNTKIISVNLSDNPISNVQTTVLQLQMIMPNVTDL